MQDDSLFDDKLLWINHKEGDVTERINDNNQGHKKKSIDEHSYQLHAVNPFKKLVITEKSHEVSPDSDPSEISESDSSKPSDENQGDRHTNEYSRDTETSSDSSSERSDSNISENGDHSSINNKSESLDESSQYNSIDEKNKILL